MKLKKRMVTFSELAEDARRVAKADHERGDVDSNRIDRLIEEFGNRPGETPIADLREWFSKLEWTPETFNRYLTVLWMVYRIGIENGKIESNPAKLLKRKKGGDGRVRLLNQFEPEQTELEYLKHFQDEEGRLRAVIQNEFPEHMPEFDIALNCGIRRKEQYVRIEWSCNDLKRRNLCIPPGKNHKSRNIPLNEAALNAFQELHRRTGGKGPVFLAKDGDRLHSPRDWFEKAVRTAGLKDFTGHDCRYTFASRLVMAGVGLRIVAELLGHKHIQMTMRYAHLAPGHNRAAVEQLDSFKEASAGQESAILGEATGEATESKTETGQKPQTQNSLPEKAEAALVSVA